MVLKPKFRLETILEDIDVGESIDVGEDVDVGEAEEAVPVLTELAVWLGGMIVKGVVFKVLL